MAYIIGTRTFGQERYLRGKVWVSYRRQADRFTTTTEVREALANASQSNPTAARNAYLINLDAQSQDETPDPA